MSTFELRQNRPPRYPSPSNISMAESFLSKMVNTHFYVVRLPLTELIGSDFTGRPGAEGQASPQTLKAPLTGLTKTAKKILSIQKHPECASLFIGNLGFAATEDSLIDLFSRNTKPTHDSNNSLLGKETWLHKVRMGTFEDSGKCKGLVPSFNHRTSNLTYTRWEQLDGPLSTLRLPSSRPWLSQIQGTIPWTGVHWLWSTLLRMQLSAVVWVIVVSQTKIRVGKRHTTHPADRRRPSTQRQRAGSRQLQLTRVMKTLHAKKLRKGRTHRPLLYRCKSTSPVYLLDQPVSQSVQSLVQPLLPPLVRVALSWRARGKRLSSSLLA